MWGRWGWWGTWLEKTRKARTAAKWLTSRGPCDIPLFGVPWKNCFKFFSCIYLVLWSPLCSDWWFFFLPTFKKERRGGLEVGYSSDSLCLNIVQPACQATACLRAPPAVPIMDLCLNPSRFSTPTPERSYCSVCWALLITECCHSISVDTVLLYAQ